LSAMRTLLASLTLLIALRAATRRAEACACCDSTTTRSPIGWSRAGGAVLIESGSNAACSHHHVLEVWPLGAPTASGCYDLLDDPELRIECGLTDNPPAAKPRPSSQRARFPVPVTTLPSSRLRVRNKPASPVGGTGVATVDLMTARGWVRLWSTGRESLHGNSQVDGDFAVPLQVTVWPNPRRDRAVVLISSTVGSGHQRAAVRWVELPADAVLN
jgi:hypothetical protein